MSRLVSKAEAWENTYKAFQQINFATYEYDSVKKSLIEYLKLYFPESFNDYIESSEAIAVLELFAYISEIIAYRLDMNAHENFITSAQRKESILRLAKLISYAPSRNIPGRGLVKINSVKTSEKIYDAFGSNLSNRKIIWNDINNTNWKSQFTLVMNSVLSQEFGSALPSERIQIDDVLFESYLLKNDNSGSTSSTALFPFNTSSDAGKTFKMELVPTEFSEGTIIERRPETGSKFNLLYAKDGLGDSSNTTGFLGFVKQGTLITETPTVFDGQTPNQIKEISNSNINDTDVWINNIDPVTLKILTDETGKIGEWVEVDISHAQNIIFNTNDNRRKYEIETLDNDKIRIIFGDGEFANIPSGTFQIWYRISDNSDYIISQNSISNQSASFAYTDGSGKLQTFTFTFSAISSIQNNSKSEDIEHIRRVAPSVYYAQDRMVNGRDYNTFMLQDPSILKLRAINRTFSGDSKYLAWHDPREFYENVKIFGDDLVFYIDNSNSPLSGKRIAISKNISSNELIINYLQPYLSSMEFFQVIAPEFELGGIGLSSIRRIFSSKQLKFNPAKTELGELSIALNDPDQLLISLWYSPTNDEWITDVIDTSAINELASITQTAPEFTGYSDLIQCVIIEKDFASGPEIIGWNLYFQTRRLITYSKSTKFWNTNNSERIITYDSLTPEMDVIKILKANVAASGTALLSSDYNFNTLGIELVDTGLPNAGQLDHHRMSVVNGDANKDKIPDKTIFPELFSDVKVQTPSSSYIIGTNRVLLPNMFVNATSTNVFDIFEEFQFRINGKIYPMIITNNRYYPPTFANNIGYWEIPGIQETSELITEISILIGPARLTDRIPDTNTITNIQPGAAGTGKFKIIGLTNNPMFYVSIGSVLSLKDSVSLNTYSYTIEDIIPSGTDAIVTVKEMISNISTFDTLINTFEFRFNKMVYFKRNDLISEYFLDTSADRRSAWINDISQKSITSRLWKRFVGREDLNFAWFHRTPRYNLIDPSATNIIDLFILTKGYFTNLKRWLSGFSTSQPIPPTPLDLRTSYSKFIDNKMISDTMVFHPGKIKLIIGSNASPELQATIKVIRQNALTLTDNQFKIKIRDIVRDFFELDEWEFGETFYFTELAGVIHSELGTEIDSVVLVPKYSTNHFGDLFQIQGMEDEILYVDIDIEDIEIVTSYTSVNIRQ